MDSMSLSLDEIIKKNKKFKGNDKKKQGVRGGKIVKKSIGIKKKVITPKKNIGDARKKIGDARMKIGDARMKIIQKNRKKIHDARERITENARKSIKDARELIQSKKPLVTKKKMMLTHKSKIPHSRSAHLTMDEDLLMDEDLDLDLELKPKQIGSLRRTIKNDAFTRSTSPTLRGMPKLPTFSIPNQREVSPPIDPFDCYNVPTRRPVPLPPPRTLSERYQPGRIMSAHMDAYFKKNEPAHKSILRVPSRSDEHDDRFETDRYVSAEPRSSRYQPNESAGIFANATLPPPRMSSNSSSSSGLIKGYRIIVTNLDTGVTESEMRELFSDIGIVLSAKILKAGTAEIIYRNMGDDKLAHEAYHNRILDGRPMKISITGPTSKSASYYRM